MEAEIRGIRLSSVPRVLRGLSIQPGSPWARAAELAARATLRPTCGALYRLVLVLNSDRAGSVSGGSDALCRFHPQHWR